MYTLLFFLFSFSCAVQCMESENTVNTTSLPQEIISLICEKCNNQKKWIPYTGDGEICYFPTTHFVKPIKVIREGSDYTVDDIINPSENTKVLPHVQSWVSSWGDIRLDNDVKRTSNRYIHTDRCNDGPPCCLFDGVNNNNIGILIIQRRLHSEPIFLLKQRNVKTNGEKLAGASDSNPGNAIIWDEQNITTLCLSNTDNKFAYSGVEENGDTFTSLVTLKEHDPDHIPTQLIKSLSPILFTKIIDLGNTTNGLKKGNGNVYLGIGHKGKKLYSFWQTRKNTIKYVEQKLPTTWYQDNGVANMAVDNAVVTASGFKPRITLLDLFNNRYIVDFLAFKDLIYLMRVEDDIKTTNSDPLTHFSYDRNVCNKVSYKHEYFKQTTDDYSLALWKAYASIHNNALISLTNAENTRLNTIISPSDIKHVLKNCTNDTILPFLSNEQLLTVALQAKNTTSGQKIVNYIKNKRVGKTLQTTYNDTTFYVSPDCKVWLTKEKNELTLKYPDRTEISNHATIEDLFHLLGAQTPYQLSIKENKKNDIDVIWRGSNWKDKLHVIVSESDSHITIETTHAKTANNTYNSIEKCKKSMAQTFLGNWF